MELIVGSYSSSITLLDAKSGTIRQTIKNIGSPGQITHLATTVNPEGKVDKIFAISESYDSTLGLIHQN